MNELHNKKELEKEEKERFAIARENRLLNFVLPISDFIWFMNLMISFKVGTDPDQAMIEVNNRVQQAMASLPDDVRRYGVTVDKKSSSILQIIALQRFYFRNKI